MRIDSLFGTDQVYYADNTISGRRNEDNQPKAMEWQPDNVNISDEARAAYAALVQQKEQEAAEQDPGPSDEFAEYMKDARGETPKSGDPLEQIEELEKLLEKLQTKLAQVAQSGQPEDAKQAEMGAISAEISSIVSQIAELMKFVEGEAKA